MLYKPFLKGQIRITAKPFALFFMSLLLVLVFYPETSGAKEANLTINGEYLSADLKETSLNAVFEALQREKGIWFKGDMSLLDEKVTVQFADQSLEEGIKRILASINHCLVYESDGVLAGAILIGKGKGASASVQHTVDVTKNATPLRVRKKKATSEKRNEADGPPISSKQYLKDFKILTNTKSQVAPAEMTPDQQLEILKILKAQPLQGTPPKMTAEQIKGLEVLKVQPLQKAPI